MHGIVAKLYSMSRRKALALVVTSFANLCSKSGSWLDGPYWSFVVT